MESAFEKAMEGERNLFEISDILSCGGRYLPHKEEESLNLKRFRPDIIHLAKDQYELLLCDEIEARRCGEISLENLEEIEMIEEALAQMDEKLIK